MPGSQWWITEEGTAVNSDHVAAVMMEREAVGFTRIMAIIPGAGERGEAAHFQLTKVPTPQARAYVEHLTGLELM